MQCNSQTTTFWYRIECDWKLQAATYSVLFAQENEWYTKLNSNFIIITRSPPTNQSQPPLLQPPGSTKEKKYLAKILYNYRNDIFLYAAAKIMTMTNRQIFYAYHQVIYLLLDLKETPQTMFSIFFFLKNYKILKDERR